MLSARVEWLDRAGELLRDAFGPADRASQTWPFDFTSYYADQMGSPLYRRFIAFTTLTAPDRLVDAKRLTNVLERHFADDHPEGPDRPVNLDVGYVTPAKLVLASMKDFAHRVYLGRGVYAEVTLLYRKGWQGLAWTFPDYASGRYDELLTACREDVLARQREEGR